MLHGIVEECGELAEAESKAAILDAAADVMIYAASYCNHMGWNLQELWDARTGNLSAYVKKLEPSGRRWLHALGKLSHHHLKAEQKIRGDRATHSLWGSRYLSAVLSLMGNTANLRLLDMGQDVENWPENAFRVWRHEVQPRSWATQKEKPSVDAG